ncbi:multicopper oxidase [Polyangium sp. 15x6]|uniref:multicopper oxidase family protein n=1 Tax=Polyangium sp. 15x6 TaxID=3042687 RepID=UPI00249BBC91|nr:multicopper oxidase [Polyangium sp. 15x6]MDI3285589.1 multicopper oxidase [Polyangium sp. 15x6]
MLSRRAFLKYTGATALTLFTYDKLGVRRALAQIPGGTLDPTIVPKYLIPLLIPPVMPKAGTIKMQGGKQADYYEISVRQFAQQILPADFFPPTTVWGYGAVTSASRSGRGLLIHNAPSLTIEADWKRPVRVKWINELLDTNGNFRPHILPVDQTLHWANPPGGDAERDTRPTFASTPGPYTGPVPIVTHVHGAVGVGDESDGYAEAWYLPAAGNIPASYATKGTWYDFFASKAAAKFGVTWGPGFATFQYPNDQRAATVWYHDHTLGMTRVNVYAGPAGFYIIRGGPDGDGAVIDTRSGKPAVLPGPAPKENDKFPPNKTYYEIPMAIQDRSFNTDGSLFYPDTREFFDGIIGPYIPDTDISPIWNPEFFGNMMMVNGNTWPFQTVERRRYRFRFLNGCQSRFLILDFSNIPGVEVWAIGNEGGFLAEPVNLTVTNGNQLLMSPAERADLIVDFTNVPVGNHVLGNLGPDEPFGGGVPGVDFPVADPVTTGQVMQFRVVPAVALDPTTPPQFLQLPAITPLPAATVTRPLALLEKLSEFFPDAPAEALLGTVGGDPNTGLGTWTELHWDDDVTENPAVGATELWEFYNATADAHPMHVHEVAFEVVNRQAIIVNEDTQQVQVVIGSPPTLPEAWETGFKDTVIAYPGQVTRIRAQFKTPGQFVWHCHIVEHEDNEMMRPYRIGPPQPGEPT